VQDEHTTLNDIIHGTFEISLAASAPAILSR